MAQRTRSKVGTKYTDDRYDRAFRDEMNATIPAVQAPVALVAPVAPVAPAAPVMPVAPVVPVVNNIQVPLNNLYKKFDTLRQHGFNKPSGPNVGERFNSNKEQDQEDLEKWQTDHNHLKEEARTAHKAAKALGIPDAKTTLFGFGSHYLDHTEHGKIFISGGKKTKKRKKRGKRMKGKRMKGKGRKTKHKKSKTNKTRKTKKTRKKKRKNFSKTKRKH